jgi:hypothetical protein
MRISLRKRAGQPSVYDLVCDGPCASPPGGGSAGFSSVDSDPINGCRKAHVCQPSETCFVRAVTIAPALDVLCKNPLASPRPSAVKPVVYRSSVTVRWAATTDATGFIVQEHPADPWTPSTPRRFAHGEQALGAGARSARFACSGDEGAYFRVCALGRSESEPSCSPPVKLVRTTLPPCTAPVQR